MLQETTSRASSIDRVTTRQVDQETDYRWLHDNSAFYAAAGSPESRNSIRRHFSRIGKDMTALEDGLSVASVRGVLRLAVHET